MIWFVLVVGVAVTAIPTTLVVCRILKDRRLYTTRPLYGDPPSHVRSQGEPW